MNSVIRVFGIFNVLLAVFFAGQIFWSRIQGYADPASFIFWTILAVGCLIAAFGYFLRIRWIVAVGAVPAILLCLFIALTSLVGGWIWGPREAGTMNLLVLGGVGLALLQLVGLSVIFISMRQSTPDETASDDAP